MTYRVQRLVLMLCVIAPGLIQADAWSRIGSFSNMRFTRTRASGYAIQLWRRDDTIVGYLLYADGPDADTPIAVLENVTFDPQTGSIGFSATLCGRIDFVGTLKGNTLGGTMTRKGSKAAVTLPLSADQTERMPDPPSYEDWRDETAILLTVRAPRCS